MILTDAVAAYLAELRPEPDPVLREMHAHAARDRIPVVVPETGAFLELLARMTGARRVVEVGTAIGVSTLHLARGVGRSGRIVTFEIDPQRHRAAGDYLARAGVAERVERRLQDAGEGLAGLDGTFDLAFLDGRKREYPGHLEQVLGLLRPGGVVAIDNVLMDGTVATGAPGGSWDAAAIARMRALTRDLTQRANVTAAVLPVGDGVALAVTASAAEG